MKKRVYTFMGIVLVAAIIGALVFMNHSKSPLATPHIQGDESHPVTTSLSQIKAKSAKNLPACIAVDDGPTKDVSETTPDQTNLVNSITGTIIDIPAGTTVDVHLKTYSNTDATGSSIYHGDYGYYNFIAKKAADNWAVTDLAACRR